MDLTIKDLTLKYGDVSVLKGLNLDMQAGKIYGLAGLNGSGKTSLLKCIAGLQKYDTGSIQSSTIPFSIDQISFLETTIFAYPYMTGRDYLDLFSARNKNFKIDEWSALFDLPIDGYISNYSSGMQKKLGFLGIVALDRHLILLDEPFNALDMEAVELVKKILSKITVREKTILITSHILETLTDTCDKIFYLKGGYITSVFDKQEFDNLKKMFHEHHTEVYDQRIRTVMGE